MTEAKYATKVHKACAVFGAKLHILRKRKKQTAVSAAERRAAAKGAYQTPSSPHTSHKAKSTGNRHSTLPDDCKNRDAFTLPCDCSSVPATSETGTKGKESAALRNAGTPSVSTCPSSVKSRRTLSGNTHNSAHRRMPLPTASVMAMRVAARTRSCFSAA